MCGFHIQLGLGRSRELETQEKGLWILQEEKKRTRRQKRQLNWNGYNSYNFFFCLPLTRFLHLHSETHTHTYTLYCRVVRDPTQRFTGSWTLECIFNEWMDTRGDTNWDVHGIFDSLKRPSADGLQYFILHRVRRIGMLHRYTYTPTFFFFLSSQ